MRRFPICTAAAASLVITGSIAHAQTPLITRSPARIGGVRAADQYAQVPGSVPVPMPGGVQPPVAVPPVGSPMGTTPMGTTPMGTTPMGTNPMGTIQPGVTPSTGTPQNLGMPREMQGSTVPSATAPNGQIIGGYPMGTEVYPGYVGGEYQGGPNTCGGPFSYLNDAPACGPNGMASEGLLAGRPGLGRFIQPGKWYSSAEYLMWWTKSNRLPPLLTTSLPADNGILGAPSTTTIFGNDSFGDSRHSGARFNLGYWFGCDQRWALDGTFFFLARNGADFNASSNSTSLLARPFTNGNTGQQFSELVAFPGQAVGNFHADYNTAVYGADANLRRFLIGGPCNRLDALAGFKFMNLNESLTLRETVVRSPNGFAGVAPNAASAVVTDMFQTKNNFYGGQLGLVGEARRGRWYLDSTLKVALGNMSQTAIIDGSQVVTNTNGTVQTVSGGLLALPGANIGTYSQNRFAVVPEATMNLGYHITPHFRVFVGYNFLYASSVLRPGDQIDTTLDTTRIPNFGSTATPLANVRPAPTLRDTTFFAQGISFGIQFKW